MKSRIQKIEIQNFKAFRKFSLNLEGRHLLLYGANGSGKSSLYWALYTFLQSASKRTPEVAKYFDPNGDQNLLNIHEDATTNLGKIALTVRDTESHDDTTFPISFDEHGTRQQPIILRGNLASDFITYRFFFGFSDFKNSEKFDIWPLFEKEILPFCVSTGGTNPLDCWNAIKHGNPNPTSSSGSGGTSNFDSFKAKTLEFAAILPSIIDSISNQAQIFYDQHFAEADPAKVNLKLKVTSSPKATGTTQQDFQFTIPIIEFGIQIDGQTVTRPQAFLNEAKLTQLALSVRFASSLVNLHESDIKLLVLDDLLVSLDMSNRMTFVEILLSDTFVNYQKVILTHDLGFFQEFRRIIGNDHQNWCFRSLQGDPKTKIKVKEEKDPIQKATDYLNGHDLEEAAHQLRKAVENTAENYLQTATGKLPKPGEFHDLSSKLKKARNILLNQMPIEAFNVVCKDFPEAHREKLVAANDSDIDSDTSLSAAEKELLKKRRSKLKAFLTNEAWNNLVTLEILDRVIRMKDRVLNPAAHWNETPLYEMEVKKALKLIKQLERTLVKSTK